MIIRRSQSQCQTRVTNSPCSSEPICSVPFPFDMCVPQNTWQRCGPIGAFVTIQWESLMRFFDIHPPSNLNVDHGLSEPSFSAVSPTDSSRHVERLQFSTPLRKWTVGRRAERFLPHTEPAPLGKTQCVLRNNEAQNPTLSGKKYVMKQSSREKASKKE